MANFYLISIDYVGPHPSQKMHRAQMIAVSSTPGIKNMSGEECTNGWLGITDDWSDTAIGIYNESEARTKLKEYGIKIPAKSPLQYTKYCHSHKDAEWYNKEFCY